MKTTLTAFLLIVCFCQVKAQQLNSFKSTDTLVSVTLGNLLKPQSQSNTNPFLPLQNLNNTITAGVKEDNMPIAVLKGYDNMPIAVLSGYDRMAVKGLDNRKPVLLKQVPLSGLPTFTTPY